MSLALPDREQAAWPQVLYVLHHGEGGRWILAYLVCRWVFHACRLLGRHVHAVASVGEVV